MVCYKSILESQESKLHDPLKRKYKQGAYFCNYEFIKPKYAKLIKRSNFQFKVCQALPPLKISSYTWYSLNDLFERVEMEVVN